jgi:ABC-type sugar transport system ATPase subunit
METKLSSLKDRRAILSVRGISKDFGGIHALSNVNLELYDKEVLAVLGDNGAGKSTLVKIISGAYSRDKGDVFVDGARVRNGSVQDSRHAGIKMIYQDLALFEVLDVTSNLFMGESISRWGFINKRAMHEEARKILGALRTTIKSLSQEVSTLSGGQQHSIAIGRGIYVGTSAKIIIMDEPTAGLGIEESSKVLELLKEIKRQVAVILISHNLDHVFEVADRAVVLRSGTVAGEVDIAGASEQEIPSRKNEIVSLMLGAI